MAGPARRATRGPRVFAFFFFQAEDGIRDYKVTGVQTCALPISDSFSAAESLRVDRSCRRATALDPAMTVGTPLSWRISATVGVSKYLPWVSRSARNTDSKPSVAKVDRKSVV